LGIYISGIITLDVLIQIPNATFILTYFAGCAAGLVLMKDSPAGSLVSAISLILTGIIFCFTGWAMIWPVILIGIWGMYLKKRRSSHPSYLPDSI
jgi:amino acid efflux transporter